MKTKTLRGALYFVTFIDDCSSKLWVYVLKSKDQVLGVFKQFQASVERELERKWNVFVLIMVVNIVNHLTNTASIKVLDTRRLLPRLLSLMVWLRGWTGPWWKELDVCFLKQSCRTHFGVRLYWPLHMLLIYLLLLLCKVMYQIVFGMERMFPMTIWEYLVEKLLYMCRNMRGKS